MKKTDKVRARIGKNLNMILLDHKLGKREFEEIFGLSQGQLAKYLQGTTSVKSDLLARISEYFKISLDTLVFGQIGQSNPAYDGFVRENHPDLFEDKKGTYCNGVVLKEDSAKDTKTMAKLVQWLKTHEADVLKSAPLQLYIEGKQKDYLIAYLRKENNDSFMESNS